MSNMGEGVGTAWDDGQTCNALRCGYGRGPEPNIWKTALRAAGGAMGVRLASTAPTPALPP
jgi:hypothetical protein